MLDPIVVDPRDDCGICGEPLYDEFQLVLVESGVMVPHRRDPRFLRAQADGKVVEILHTHCILQRGKIDWARPDDECNSCERLLVEGDRVYRLKTGQVDPEGNLIESQRANSKATLCEGCMFDIIGEGDLEEGRALIGVFAR
jgi:hypothetical protein